MGDDLELKIHSRLATPAENKRRWTEIRANLCEFMYRKSWS